MNNATHFSAEHTLDIAASPEAIWRLFSDVPGWKRWNAGIEEIRIMGPFAQGTEFSMKPPGQDAFTSRLTHVTENERFVDETRVGDLVVTVTHALQKLDGGRTRVVYAIDARGPEAEHIGPAISSDFPDVLRALASTVS
jgi:uncharacterized protein YndB with AHSA1/START domain